MAIKNRAELKSYFVKNAIPTEGNFIDLIDSQLNQAQDGVFRREGEPLSVVAAPGDQKRVLRLYDSYPSVNPDWMLSLNPAQDPANPAATGKPGLGITDGAGQTRLFVDKGTGRVGVGTNTPRSALDVAGEAQVQRLSVTGPIVPSVGNSQASGIQFPPDPGGGGGDRAFIRYFVESGEATHLLIGNNNDANDRVSLYQQGAERLTVHAGRVGINNVSPSVALDVTGDANVSGRLSASGGLRLGNIPGHIDVDGALYRSSGQVYLTVDDNFYVRDKGTGNLAAHFQTNNGNLILKGRLSQASDRSLKRDIEPLRRSLDKILALRGVTYRRRDLDDDALHLGLVAQEVEEVFPELVSTGASGERGIAYTELVAPLIEAVKELHAEVARLRALLGPDAPDHREPPVRA